MQRLVFVFIYQIFPVYTIYCFYGIKHAVKDVCGAQEIAIKNLKCVFAFKPQILLRNKQRMFLLKIEKSINEAIKGFLSSKSLFLPQKYIYFAIKNSNTAK